jgi:hypothetical protein
MKNAKKTPKSKKKKSHAKHAPSHVVKNQILNDIFLPTNI